MNMTRTAAEVSADVHAQQFAKRKGLPLDHFMTKAKEIGLVFGKPDDRDGTFWLPILHQDGEDAGFGAIPITPEEAAALQ